MVTQLQATGNGRAPKGGAAPVLDFVFLMSHSIHLEHVIGSIINVILK